MATEAGADENGPSTGVKVRRMFAGRGANKHKIDKWHTGDAVKTLSRRNAKRAVALYDFEGKPEFGEITLHAKDDLLVLKEDVGDGWSLVDCRGEVGLLPRSYYSVKLLDFDEPLHFAYLFFSSAAMAPPSLGNL